MMKEKERLITDNAVMSTQIGSMSEIKHDMSQVQAEREQLRQQLEKAYE